MDYSRFVRLRSALWDDFAAGLERARDRRRRLTHQELEDLAIAYRQLLHDHALATARYPETSAARRVARLVLEGTRLLVRERAQRPWSIRRFFRSSFPEAFRRLLPLIGLSAALFAVTALFGLVVTLAAPGVGVAFVGSEAASDLERGRIWTEALTTTIPPAVSTSGIATNNISVALTAWAGGALAGLGSLYVLLLNGFVLGAVVGVTLHYAMHPQLFEFIAAHGPLELTLVIVCAGGGLGLARGLVAADDGPRAEVLRRSARDALTLLAGCLPWFLVLAAVEVLLSPSPELSPALKASVGAALLATFLIVATGARPARGVAGRRDG
jgi:uncharacterized membrane protein SpoIIM required for sporulation